MQKQSILAMMILIVGLLLAACAPEVATQDTMMEQAPTDAMMEEKPTGAMMEETPADAMMEEKPTDVMMEEKPTEAMMEDKAPDAMMEKTGTPEMMDDKPMDATPDAMMEETPLPVTGGGTSEAGMMDEKSEMMAPAWFSAELTDEVSGETFQIEDYKGKVVLVETFAQWCPTCLSQQREMVKLHEMLGMQDDLVTVSLDIDPNEDAAMLQKYLEKHGFAWRFTIAPPETAREIGQLYGAQFLNPPSAPMLIIDRHGEVHPLPVGVKSAEDLQKALEPFLKDNM